MIIYFLVVFQVENTTKNITTTVPTNQLYCMMYNAECENQNVEERTKAPYSMDYCIALYCITKNCALFRGLVRVTFVLPFCAKFAAHCFYNLMCTV